MENFIKIELFTDTDGQARFREISLPLNEGTLAAALSPLNPSSGMQFRQSPVGFRSSFHCTVIPQWVFILKGTMQIGLQDGSSRIFLPGEHFFSNDIVPAGQVFNPSLHGHWSAQVGQEPLQTLFVRA